jgi:1-aminocyclopropane-1-carboxylate deaminase
MLEKFERYPLTFGPTHIEKLSRLTEHLGGKVELYAKREDCNSGLAFGGNKLREAGCISLISLLVQHVS